MRFDSYGNYSVLIGGEEWLRSAPTSFTLLGRTFSTHDDSLKLLKRASENGTDTLGPWNAVNFYYRPSDVLVTIKVSVKFYVRESCVIFSQVMLSSDVLVTIKVSVKFYICESCVIFSQVMLSSDVLVTIKVSVKFYIRESCVIFSQVMSTVHVCSY